MSKLFLTDPDNQSDEDKSSQTRKLSGAAFWRWRNRVVEELQHMGMPQRAAEVAVIDLKNILIPCLHSKLTPHQTARMLFDKASTIYKDVDGTWHYLYG